RGLMTRCRDCGLEKPDSDFPRNRSTSSGRGAYCKDCHNRRGRESVRKAGGSRHYHLRQKYGMGADEVKELTIRQGGLCAVCRMQPAVQVDHDHETGSVRGVVCLNCNGGMGHFRDDPVLLAAAAAYLRRG